MWELIFNSANNRGVDINRSPRKGEFIITMERSKCGWFREFPSRYQYVDGNLSEFPLWLEEQEVLTAQINDKLAKEEQLKIDILAEKESVGLDKESLSKIKEWVDAEISKSKDFDELKINLISVLSRVLLPYILQ